MVHLRARCYAPYLSQFFQPDTIVPDLYQPADWNRYSYVRNNPVNFTDPSGISPYYSQGTNERDLTWWLYKELTTNANSHYIQRINSLMSGTMKDKIRGLTAFLNLEQDRAKWDFKHKIYEEMRKSIVLLDTVEGYRWYEYSVPGNIHYGFVGRAAGIPAWLLHAGASGAEIYDPAHLKRDVFGVEICCPCPEGKVGELCKKLLCWYINPAWIVSGFDSPKDWSAVETGVELFASGGKNISFMSFIQGLSSRGQSLDRPVNTPVWNWENRLGGWPYSVGRFNGPREAEFEPIILDLLKR
jgi:hypothetical protein